MSPRPVVGVMALARATFDVAHAEETASRAFATLDALDAEIVGPRSLLFDEDAARNALADLKQKRLDLMLILQVTFTDAGMTKRIAEEIEAPLAFWAFPEPRTGGRLRLNSLCGVNLARARAGEGGAQLQLGSLPRPMRRRRPHGSAASSSSLRKPHPGRSPLAPARRRSPRSFPPGRRRHSRS